MGGELARSLPAATRISRFFQTDINFSRFVDIRNSLGDDRDFSRDIVMPPSDLSSPTFVIVMGVSGCGKTTIAEAVASEIGGVFLEGDSFHPPANKAKMGSGIPLVDEDRWPWFDTLVAEASAVIEGGVSPVLACSALKQRYRDYLVERFPRHRLVYLKGSYELIKGRMDAREHEYMTSTLLKSQFDILEEPAPGPGVLTLPIEKAPGDIVAAIVAWLHED